MSGDRILRDVHRARHLLRKGGAPAAEMIDYTSAALGDLPADRRTGPVIPEDLERHGRRSVEHHRTQQIAVSAVSDATLDSFDPFDLLADDLDQARVVDEGEAAWTPERVLARIMLPVTRIVERVRRADRAVTVATQDASRARASWKAARIRQDPSVKAVLAADLDVERQALLPIVKAALGGTSPRWRHRAGRVFDEKGRDLVPQCLRPWQVL